LASTTSSGLLISEMEKWDLIVIGGGAAGFFGAINAANQNKSLKILILERGKKVLEKVKISGGGRCNVTHSCFDPSALIHYYPRGNRELLGPFHKFGPDDTLHWFESRGVPLKTESDGRVFPTSNDSNSIINCLQKQREQLGIELKLGSRVTNLKPLEGKGWFIQTDFEHYQTTSILVATGSNPKIYKLLAKIGLPIIAPVPSLFTFNCKDSRIKGLPGISVNHAKITITSFASKGKLTADGPLLITHWGFSGPAILKLSAWGARTLNDVQYQFTLKINWLGIDGLEIEDFMAAQDKKNKLSRVSLKIPQRLWLNLLNHLKISPLSNWGDLSKKDYNKLLLELTAGEYKINGKSTFKEEFVTAGGVDLKAIDFKTFQSKDFPGLFFAGEVLNIDGVTGGFNFQAAWTGSWLAAKAIATSE
jgi:predicted Rossmann fold flavoprotein